MEQRVFVTQMAFESNMVGLKGQKEDAQRAFEVSRKGVCILRPSIGYVPGLRFEPSNSSV